MGRYRGEEGEETYFRGMDSCHSTELRNDLISIGGVHVDGYMRNLGACSVSNAFLYRRDGMQNTFWG
jgi:hypothetical protein